jgi:hypothetical protein
VTLTRSGTAGNPITLRSYPGESAVIDGQGTVVDLLSISSDYVNVTNLAVRGSVGPGGASIYGKPGSDHVLLSQLDISSSGGQGVHTDASTAFYTVDRNYIHDIGRDSTRQTHGLYMEGADHRISNNLIVRVPYGWGVHIYPYARRVKIVDNTVDLAALGPILIGGDGSGPEGSGVSDVDVVNNIGTTAPGAWGVQCYQSPGNYRIHHNLFFGVQSLSDCSLGTGNVLANPLYVNPAAGDYHVLTGSPAINTGDDSWTYPLDYDGVSRPQGPHDDKGAYER